MLKYLTSKWNFLAAGATIALLVMFFLYLLDTAPGMDDAFIVLSKYCGNAMEDKSLDPLPRFDWQKAFIIGIILGAFIATAVSAEFKLEIFPADRQNKGFFSSLILSPLVLMSGGFLVMFGLQLAGDSFFGVLSSAMQLSTGAWAFLLSAVFTIFFIAAVAVVKLEKGD